MTDKSYKLLVLDVDNTLFDWVAYYVDAFGSMLTFVAKKISVPYQQLAEESKVVFDRHGSIEFPFVLQELPSVMLFYGDDIDRMLDECVAPAREIFRKKAIQKLILYSGVMKTLETLQRERPNLPIVALTDAPRYVAMWKLNKLGILPFFDSVYGLTDPRIPTDSKLGRVKVDAHILLKHLQQNNFSFKGRIRTLPDEYEKPGIRGLKTVLMDYNLDGNKDQHKEVLWVGDNVRKDIKLGKILGVTTAWARYGTVVQAELMEDLRAFSPERNIHKNASLPLETEETPKPDIELVEFSDVLSHLI